MARISSFASALALSLMCCPATTLAAETPQAGSSPADGSAVVVAPLAQAPAAAPPKPAASQPADIPATPRFDIESFAVEGNTLLPAEAIAEAVRPYTGARKDFGDVQRALEAVQLAYQNAGYGTVQVLLPEQELDRGVVRLRVIEIKLGKVTIEGNQFFDADNIRRSFPSLVEGTTPNSRRIAANARVANENPAKQSTVVLRAGANENEVDATVRVTDEKFWRGSVSLDNTGSPSTGDYRLGFGFQHANMFNLDHSLTMQYVLSPSGSITSDYSNVKIFGAGYRVPVYRHGDSMDFIVGYSDVGNATVQNLFNLGGSGTIFSARYNFMLARPSWADDYEHRVSIAQDYKAFSNQVTTIGSTQNLVPDVTVYPASIAYAGTWRASDAELNILGAFSRNMVGHGPDANEDNFNGPNGARPGVGTVHYQIFRYNVTYVKAFATDVQVRFNLNGQYTADALVPGEQYGIGGWDSVRGMLERELANDRGQRFTMELYSPDVAPFLKLEGVRLRFLAFMDAAKVRRNHALPGEQVRESASSYGFGLRANIRPGVSVRLDIGEMMDGAGESTRGVSRWHGGIAWVF